MSANMNPLAFWIARLSCVGLCCFASQAQAQSTAPGIFEGQKDIGDNRKPGFAEYHPDSRSYLVGGGGENMWFTNDAFHFVWKKMDGDFAIESKVSWVGEGVNAHRKGCLMIRQTLDSDSPYIDAALHGDGLTSLQYREVRGGMTREIQSALTKPAKLRIVRQGDAFTLWLAGEDGAMVSSGCAHRLSFTGPLYVGLGVCAHDNSTLEKARFSEISIQPMPKAAAEKQVLQSTLETIAIASKDRKTVYHSLDPFEAPNWSRDGRYLLYNGQGKMWRITLGSPQPEPVDTGFAIRCNNDHGISFDGKTLAISDQTKGGKSLIYTLPVEGGTPRQITPTGPSYWHGWSPDGKSLVYCGERGGEFDVYKISTEGGSETRLTTASGLDDGPEYTADGKWIYFNSDRTGTMQIWRMAPDGSGQEQATKDSFNNWFAHPSPDGRWIVFLSYEADVKGHPANKPVMLRLMPLGGGPIDTLATLFGGQGTINVPSWSPDSRNVAFVSYEFVTENGK